MAHTPAESSSAKETPSLTAALTAVRGAFEVAGSVVLRDFSVDVRDEWAYWDDGDTRYTSLPDALDAVRCAGGRHLRVMTPDGVIFYHHY